MSNVQAVTMQELELESAELLPSRETLNCVHTSPHPSNSFSQSNWGIGNTNQAGGGLLGNISALNGNLSGNTIVLW
jgi:hypothetical protein